MAIPAKPCLGGFAEDTIILLQANRAREQWLPHPCTLCGQSVAARLEKGLWTPEKHWPSVRYVPRAKRAQNRPPALNPAPGSAKAL